MNREALIRRLQEEVWPFLKPDVYDEAFWGRIADAILGDADVVHVEGYSRSSGLSVGAYPTIAEARASGWGDSVYALVKVE